MGSHEKFPYVFSSQERQAKISSLTFVYKHPELLILSSSYVPACAYFLSTRLKPHDAIPLSFVTPHPPKLAITSKWHNEDIKMVISLVWQSKTCEVRSETSRECDDFRSHGFPFYYCSLGRFHWFDFFRSVACVRFFAFFLLVWVPERNRCSLINQKRGRSVSNGEYGCMFINCIHANSLCSRIYYRACFLTTFQGCNFTEEREISGRKMSVLGRGGWGRRCWLLRYGKPIW